MDKRILIEYCGVREEIKDIRKRIEKLGKEITNLTEVTDSVKGTRRDGTIGNIRISGYPMTAFYKKNGLIGQYREKLARKEIELLGLTIKAEEYIEEIERSRLRIMFRFYYVDDLTWELVAMKMNYLFPKKRISFTKDSCRMVHDRYLEKVV